MEQKQAQSNDHNKAERRRTEHSGSVSKLNDTCNPLVLQVNQLNTVLTMSVAIQSTVSITWILIRLLETFKRVFQQ